MYGNINESIKDMTDERKNHIIRYYDKELNYLLDMVDYYREKAEKAEEQQKQHEKTESVKDYDDLLYKNNKLYSELEGLADIYNNLLKEYKKLKLNEGKRGQEIEALTVELEKLKGKTDEEIKRVKNQEMKNLEAVGQYIEKLEHNQFKPNRTRGCSLSKHKKEAVIKSICKGLNDSEISRNENIDRKTVKKIRTAGYKSKKTNQDILDIINHLLKINQNPDYIKKLQGLKQVYLSK